MKLGILTDTHLGLVQYGLKEREQDFMINILLQSKLLLMQRLML